MTFCLVFGPLGYRRPVFNSLHPIAPVLRPPASDAPQPANGPRTKP